MAPAIEITRGDQVTIFDSLAMIDNNRLHLGRRAWCALRMYRIV